jgi:type IV pilus assembly protein PilQ
MAGGFLLSLSLLCVSVSYAALEEPVAIAQQQGETAENPSVDLDLKDVDIKDVAIALSRISGKNIIVSDEIKVKVTLRVKGVNWREALNMVLGAYNFAMQEKENNIIVTTMEKRRQAEESGDMETRVISFNFVNVADIQKTLLSMLTTRGKIETDTRTNSLVITDIPDRIDRIEKVAQKLDTKTPQVIIEAMMIDLKLNDEDQLGIDWTLTHKKVEERSIQQTLKLTGSASGQINYGRTIFPWAQFTSLINFWNEEKRVNILANPKVLTLDNLIASIQIIEQVPYTQQTQSDQGTVASTQFKDVGIKLDVKPHITKDNFIFMNIKTEQSFRSGFTPDNQPIIDSRKAETNLMVKDGETIVIGGLRKKEDATTVDKFPLLGDIPVVGGFFKRNNKSLVESELVIFVTPHIATDISLTNDEKDELQEIAKMKEKKLTALPVKEKYLPLRPPASDTN